MYIFLKYTYKFPLSTALAASQTFRSVLFLLSFISKYFLVLDFFLDPLTIKNVLFNFNIWFTQISFYYWFLIEFHCSWRTYLVDFIPFIFVEVCSIASHTVCLGECSMCTWKNVCPGAHERKALWMSVRSGWLIVFKFSFSSLNFFA